MKLRALQSTSYFHVLRSRCTTWSLLDSRFRPAAEENFSEVVIIIALLCYFNARPRICSELAKTCPGISQNAREVRFRVDERALALVLLTVQLIPVHQAAVVPITSYSTICWHKNFMCGGFSSHFIYSVNAVQYATVYTFRHTSHQVLSLWFLS